MWRERYRRVVCRILGHEDDIRRAPGCLYVKCRRCRRATQGWTGLDGVALARRIEHTKWYVWWQAQQSRHAKWFDLWQQQRPRDVQEMSIECATEEWLGYLYQTMRAMHGLPNPRPHRPQASASRASKR